MKKIYLALFALLVLQQITLAQTINVDWGPELNDFKGSTTTKIIGGDKRGFFTIRAGNGVFLEHYNTNNNLTFSQEIKIAGAEGVKVMLENIFYLDGQLIMFTKHLNSSTNHLSLYAYKLNTEGKVLSNAKLIDEMTLFNNFNGDFSLSLSDDSSKVIIFNRAFRKQKETESFSLKLINNNLDEVWAKEIQLDLKNGESDVESIRVDNNGNAFVLISIEKADRKIKNVDLKGYYSLIVYYSKADLLKEYTLRIKDKYLYQATMELAPDGKLAIAGLFSDGGAAALGTFFMRLDQNTKLIETQEFYDFNQEFLKSYGWGNKWNKNGINYLSLKDIQFLDNGELFLIAEESYRIERSGGSITYMYGPIVIFNIGMNGNFKWVSTLNKRQESNSKDIVSFIALSKDNKLVFMFNDDERNLNEKRFKELKPLNRINQAATFLAIMSLDGKYEKTLMMAEDERNTILYPHLFLFKDNKAIIHALKRKKFSFGTVTLN